MPFHLIAAEESLGASAFTELDAINDDAFSWRNNHFMFSEKWFLIGAYIGGVDLQRMRWNVSSWNSFGRMHLQPTNNDADVPDNLEIIDYRDYPLELPQNEELALEGFQDNAGAQDSRFVGWIAPPNGLGSIPRGRFRTLLRGTATITTVANAWTNFGAITLDDNPKGGVYSVIGAIVFSLGPFAYRLNFPRARSTQGRLLRPGGLCQQDPDERPLQMNFPGGEWGRFHTFELPTLSLLGHAAAAETPVIYLDCVYLGDETGLLSI
jgi:hypothetical protein